MNDVMEITHEKPEGDYVWDIFENAWVTRDYWNYVNQRGKYAPAKVSK